jgi:hypothetical protein
MSGGWGNLAAPLGRLVLIGLAEAAMDETGSISDFERFCESLYLDVRMGSAILRWLEADGTIVLDGVDSSPLITDWGIEGEIVWSFDFTLTVN